MVDSSEARRGSVAGASGDAGVQYRRGVAAYTVACGLAGVSLPRIEIPPAHARVASVTLETDDPVDDIRIDFDSGWQALVQAKRSLKAGKPLKEAVAQWVHAARDGLDPAKDRLVIVAGALSGPMRHLQQVLDRGRTDHPGAPTKPEAHVLKAVRRLLGALDEQEQDRVLKCAVIWELQVEEPDDPGAQLAMNYLRHVVAGGTHKTARDAWKALVEVSGRAARLRGGYKIASWLDALHGEGIEIGSTGSTPAAALETRRLALQRYIARVTREGTQIDLRALGAELPSLPLAQADANIKVGTDTDDARSASELIWAFLRRGRVVLTGLPGGGKSTALKQLAAQLASDWALPLPVRVSLREVNTAGSQSSFRDRLIAVAVRDDRPGDRIELTHEINERLDRDGGIALLLDSLDETYDQRRKVVSEIADLVADLPAGVCILLSTRDVAYGQASTLGWPALRLRSPSEVESTVTAVLEAAASQRRAEPTDRADWVAQRAAWVRSSLAQDEQLRETPLLPVLLALLAARKSTQSLPTRRARILEAVVKHVVADHEVQRRDGRTLGPLTGTALNTASMHAFTSEAAEILNSRGQADAEAVAAAIAADLGEPWGLPPAQAMTAAWEAVRLFDETGIFVMSGADETIAPRITLFAEIGDAMRIVSRPQEIPTWVAARIAAQQFESLVLACALGPSVARAASDALQSSPGNIALAKALAQADREGADLDDATVRQVCESLIAHIAEGTQDAWLSWTDLLRLSIPVDLHASAEAAAAHHGTDYALVARASLALHFRPDGSSLEDPQMLKDLLRLRSLPRRPSTGKSTMVTLDAWMMDRTLGETQQRAAEALLEHVPDASSLIAALAIDAPYGLQESLTRLLDDRGFDEDVQAIQHANAQRFKDFRLPSWASEGNDTAYAHFLELVADHATADLTAEQATLLDELAEFVETMEMNDGGVTQLHKQPDDVLRELIALTASLYGFDRSVLAAQAKIAWLRLEHWDGNAPYFALFDAASKRSRPDWTAVHDRDAAVRLLMRLLTLGLGQAVFAARSLYETSVAEQAAPQLRQLLPRLRPSTRHERIAAVTLASLTPGPEPDCWTDSEDPVLRAVAASMIEPVTGNTVGAQFRQLLDDPDGHVQEAALRHLIEARPPELTAIMNDVLARPRPGWMCLNCRTVNLPPGSTSCTSDKCSTVGADPAKLAAEFLQTKPHDAS
ncbi:NACHT domain-containing protein [Streptomyces paromomycinus]|uniref:NACHT domain-containing protein n=1 Tax=Streptomyces paromomycinus TaxID=92743 RepID=UPI000F62279D|nr:ATP-binding protein [Streptomyces paromomycinus]